MASGSYFLVYFDGPCNLDDAERELRQSALTVTRQEDQLSVRFGDGPELFIGLDEEPHVRLEAEELAEEHAAPPLSACARRFEVAFDDLEAVLDDTNTLAETHIRLQDLTRGWVRFSWNGNLLVQRGAGDLDRPCACASCQLQPQ